MQFWVNRANLGIPFSTADTMILTQFRDTGSPLGSSRLPDTTNLDMRSYLDWLFVSGCCVYGQFKLHMESADAQAELSTTTADAILYKSPNPQYLP